jgi:hypothetical protein
MSSNTRKSCRGISLDVARRRSLRTDILVTRAPCPVPSEGEGKGARGLSQALETRQKKQEETRSPGADLPYIHE